MKQTRDVLPGIREAIQAFVIPTVATRMLQLADARTEKAHRKLTLMLAHFESFKPECVYRPATDADFARRAAQLTDRHVDALWDVLSEMPSVDGRSVTLDELSRTTYAQGFGTLAAIPGARCAYFQGEEQNSLVLLSRPE